MKKTTRLGSSASFTHDRAGRAEGDYRLLII